MRQLILAALLLARTLSAGGTEHRVEFLAVADGKRVEGSEICFFPADADDGFFAKFLATNDVRCLSGDAVLDLPRGAFNVFARNASTLVSSHPTFLDNSTPGEPGYRVIEVPLLPAATLEVSTARTALREHEWLAVYLANETQPESPASVRPIAPEEARVAVPAGMTLVPMIVRRASIVRVGPPLVLRAGEMKSVDPVSKWNAGRTIVTLLKTDALAIPGVTAKAPTIDLLTGSGEPLRPLLPPRQNGRFERSLAIFTNVPAGTHRVRLHGDGWQPDEVTVTAPTALGVATAPRPLMGSLAATLEVRTGFSDLVGVISDIYCPGLERAPDDLDEELSSVENPPPVLRALRCAKDAARCETVRERTLAAEEPEQVVTWSDLAPGEYVAELAFHGLTARSERAEARAGRSATVSAVLQPETVTGRVTQGGSPVQALVTFEHSVGAALSDETGRYTAVVEGGPRRSSVTVRLCEGGGTFRYIPLSPIDKTLDIAIPKNRLVVRVLDEQRRPVANVRVHGGPLFENEVHTYLPFPQTDASGQTHVENVATDAQVQLCAAAGATFEPSCAGNFEMGTRESHVVEITLRRRTTMTGRLVAGAPFVGAVIWLVSPQGVVLDGARVAADGQFTIKQAAGTGEYLVTASVSHPLAVFELPPQGSTGTLEYAMPQPRSLSITLSPRSNKRQFALEMSNRPIPPAALSLYLGFRRLRNVLAPGETVTLPDLGGASFAVYSIPYITDYPPEWSGLDPMEHPHLRITLPRFVVNGAIVEIE